MTSSTTILCISVSLCSMCAPSTRCTSGTPSKALSVMWSSPTTSISRLILARLVQPMLRASPNFSLPPKIHRQRITLEEEKTGIASSQQKDLPFHAALADPKTRAEYIRRELPSIPVAPLMLKSSVDLQQLNWKTGAFVKAMLDSTNKMPYSMRYLIRETLAAVRVRITTYAVSPNLTFSRSASRMRLTRSACPALRE